MDINQAVNFLLGIFTVIFTYYMRDYWQSNNLKAELLEKLDFAIQNNKKHNACELFYMIHKLRLDYEEILKLVEEDNASKIIYALRRTPGLLDYKDGKLIHKKSPRTIALAEKVFKIFIEIMLGFLIVFLFILLTLLVFSKGLLLLKILIQITGLTLIIASFLGIRRDYRIVDELIKHNP